MASSKKQAAGVIGLGSMGLGVARTLLKKGFEVHAFDVRPEVSKAFAKEGGIAAKSPADVGRNAPVVIILVVNADQTNEVLFGNDGAVSTLAKGSVVIASSTVAPEFAIDLGKRLDAKGLLLIDAPVSGGAARAAKGELSIMGSGSRAAFKKADAVLKAIAIKVYELGEDAGTGSKVKMINQLLAGVHIAAAAEAMALNPSDALSRELLLRGHEDGNWVVASVKDSGPGIKRTDVGHLVALPHRATMRRTGTRLLFDSGWPPLFSCERSRS